MLKPNHRAEWQASAVDSDIIRRNVWSIEDAREVDALLNRNIGHTKHSSDLVPCWAVAGIDPMNGGSPHYGLQIKPDNPPIGKNGKPQKYICPSRKPAEPLFLSSEKHIWTDVLADVSRPLMITEGAKKAGAVMSQWVACVSLPGVWNGQIKGELHDRLKPFCKVGRKIYLCFDNDLLTKEQVRNALDRLGRLISAEGPVVRVCLLPEGELKGIDDYLASFNVEDRPKQVEILIARSIPFEAWRKPLQEAKKEIEHGRCQFAERYLVTKKLIGHRLSFNQLTHEVEIDQQPFDVGDLQVTLAVEYDFHLPDNQADKILFSIAKMNPYHPVVDYLSLVHHQYGNTPGLLESLAKEILGAEGKFFAAMVAKTLIAAVARAYYPGCKVDTALILQGRQGLGKSAFFKTLASPKWFDDSLGHISDKDERLKLHKVWFVEWAELESVFRRRDMSAVKAFISSSSDLIRPPYGRTVQRYRRSSIIVGTTNQDDFLSDPTGNRRFWVVPCSKPINISRLSSIRDKVWACAVDAYKRGVKWWLDGSEQAFANDINDQFMVRDPWEFAIAAYCESRHTITTGDLMTELLRIDLDRRTKADEMRIAAILKNLGWEQRISGKDRRRIWSRKS